MIRNKLYIIYLLSSVLGVLLLLSVLVSRLVAYFETPESTQITSLSIPTEDIYKPTYNWRPLKNEGRRMEVKSLTKITRDYLNSFYEHNQYLSTGNTAGIHDHFTKKSRPKVKYASFLNSKTQRFEYTTLSHDLELKLYADDGTLVVMEDTQVNYHQLYENDQFISGYYDTARFEVMLLLEDNFWRVRHKIRANVESKFSIAKVNNSMQYVTTRDAKFYYSEEEFRSKGINYYPADYPWDLFWPNFHKIPLKDDFELISNAGFNTVRIFVPYHQFGGSNVDDNELKKLTGLLDLAQSNNLKVIVTLFDFFLDYSVDRWTLSERHLEKVVSSFKDHPAIMAWDIKNEPDLDFEQHGKNEVKEWLKFITLCIRKYDSNHLVTIGWSNPKYLDDISDYVDYYSFHYYNDPKELNNYLEMDFDKPIVLEETGQHSYNAWWYPFHKSAQDQEDYTSEILEVIDHYDLSYSFWTLYDFQNIPDNVVGTVYWRKGIQKNFGFIDRYNKPKPSFEVVKNYNLLEL